eukprot:gene3559-7082_t
MIVPMTYFYLLFILGYVACNVERSNFIASVKLPAQSFNSKPVFVCTTFGFDSAISETIYNEVFDSSFGQALLSKSVDDQEFFIIKCDDPIKFKEIGGGDLSLGFIHASQLLGNVDNILSNIQAALEASLARRETTKLALLISCPDGSDITKLKDILLRTIEEAWKMSPCSENAKSLEEILQINIHLLPSSNNMEEMKNFIWNIITEASKEVSNIQSGKTLASNLNPIQKNIIGSNIIKTSTSTHEDVLQTILQDISQSLDVFKQSTFIPYTTEEIIASVKLVFDDYHLNHNENSYNKLIELLQNSSRLYYSLSNLLQPIYRQLLASTLSSAKDSFSARLKKIPANKNIHKNIRNLCEKTSIDFENSVRAIHTAFLNLLKKPISNLNGQQVQDNNSPSNQQININIDFPASLGYGYERTNLKLFIEDKAHERINFLFLEGLYNPFIRTAPIPPTHLNLNYLFDPRAYEFGRVYNNLYDEHKDGAAENRADQLRVPELSRVVFDPNLHPVPKEKRNLWKAVLDFYRNEL